MEYPVLRYVGEECSLKGCGLIGRVQTETERTTEKKMVLTKHLVHQSWLMCVGRSGSSAAETVTKRSGSCAICVQRTPLVSFRSNKRWRGLHHYTMIYQRCTKMTRKI